MATLVGKTIAGYSLTEALGRGPTGETFAASSAQGAPASVKLVYGRLSLMDRVDGMKADIERLGKLAHPHVVVPSFTKWTTSGRYLMASELLDGLPLDRVLATVGRLPACQVLRFAGQVCLALEAAHGADVVHGALKPANVFLVRAAEGGFSTRVTDFACHTLLGDEPAPDRTARSVAGADPVYCAPEILSGADPGASGDIYALGVMVYEALAGQPPVAGDTAASVRESLDGLADKQPPASVPVGLRDLLARALDRDPSKRFSTVEAFRQALEAWAAESPSELADPALSLFDGTVPTGNRAKDATAPGVADLKNTPPSVRVREDEARLFDNEEPEKVASNDGKQTSSGNNGADRSLEEQELAAMAEQASAALRTNKDGEAGNDQKSTAEVLASEPDPGPSSDRHGTIKATPAARKAHQAESPDAAAGADSPSAAAEDVELPQERTVKAFVSNISPSVPDEEKSGSNGESLELAFDQFVTEAKAVNTALPKPIVSDDQLAELALIPVVAPAPAPEPVKPAPMLTAALPLTTPPPPPPKSPLPALLGGVVVGGLLVFGGIKLLGSDAPPTPPPSTPAAQTTTGTPAAGNDRAAGAASAVAEPDAAATATAEPDAAATATAEPDAAPASADTTAAAAASGDAAPAAEPDAAATPPTKLVAKKTPTKMSARKARRRRAIRARKARAAKKARKARATKKVTKPATKKKKSDWVDPFSQ